MKACQMKAKESMGNFTRITFSRNVEINVSYLARLLRDLFSKKKQKKKHLVIIMSEMSLIHYCCIKTISHTAV